jgi:hypothetical protein
MDMMKKPCHYIRVSRNECTMLNRTQVPTEWLKKAIDKGYKNWQLIKTGEQLVNICSKIANKNMVSQSGKYKFRKGY